MLEQAKSESTKEQEEKMAAAKAVRTRVALCCMTWVLEAACAVHPAWQPDCMPGKLQLCHLSDSGSDLQPALPELHRGWRSIWRPQCPPASLQPASCLSRCSRDASRCRAGV